MKFTLLFGVLTFALTFLALRIADGAETQVVVDGKTMTPEEAWRYIQKKSQEAQAKTAPPPAGETKTGTPPAGEAKKSGEADLLGDAGKAAPAAAGKEKLPDPRLTPEEKDTLALAARASKLGNISVEQVRALRAVSTSVGERLWASAAQWTIEDYKQRMTIYRETLDAIHEARTGEGSVELRTGMRAAHREWLAAAGEDMPMFLTRLEQVGKHIALIRNLAQTSDAEMLKAAVVTFMEQGKYRNTPPVQKIKFVQAYAIPRAPVATAEFNRLIEFYKEEAKGLPPSPTVNKTPVRR